MTSIAEEVSTPNKYNNSKITELKDLLNNKLFIIDKKNNDVEEQEKAIAFFDDMAIDRYLRARSNNVKAAYDHIEKSYKWRIQNKPLQIFCSYCIEDRHSHSLRLLGIDQKSQRPVIYSCMYTATRRNNLKSNMEHMTRTFEDAQYLIKKTREEREKEESKKDKPKSNGDDNGIKEEEEEDLTPTSEQWVVFFDLYGFGIYDCDPRTAVYTAHLLTHYPERLSLGVVVDAPWGWAGLWSAISPILDERTRKKIVFVRSKAKPEDKDSVESICGLGEEESKWLRKEINIQREISKPDDHSYWLPPPVKEKNENDNDDDEVHDSRGFKSFVNTKLYIDILSKNAIYKDLVICPEVDDNKKNEKY